MTLVLADSIQPFALGLIGAILVWRLLCMTFQGPDHKEVWTRIEAVGVSGNGIFPWTRAVVGSILSIQKNAHEGYKRICKAKDRPFTLPTMWTGGAVVVLPPSLLPLLNKPDTELSGFRALIETIQLPYMISNRDIYENVIHFDVVRKILTKKEVIGSLAPTTAEELDIAFRECWGVSERWQTMNGWDVCGRIITRAALRTLIGEPLCRDETFLEQSRLYANSLFAGTAIINCLPPLVRPLLGPLLALRAKYYQARCQKVLRPYVEERIRLWNQRQERDNQPNDFLQWMIPKCSSAHSDQLEPNKTAMRLLALNTMFIFAMGYVFAHCIFDLYSSSPSPKAEFLHDLEEECKRVFVKHHGLSTKAAIDSLYRVDSSIRESMRLSDVGVTNLPLDVVSGKISLGNGIQVPPGVRMVFPTQSIHLDPSNYEQPLCFDAFRFSRRFETLEVPNKQLGERELLTSPTPSFLAFGYGRHGCPGRWFVAQTIKQALAYVIMNYDVELAGAPIKRKALLNMMVPPTNAQIRIRRKSQKETGL